MTGGLEVVDAGALATVQDQGRPGYAHLGVPRSGALDAPAAALANRLVGNDPQAAVIETTATGCVLRATEPLVVAVTGARCPVRIGPVLGGTVLAPFGSPLRLGRGQTLEVGEPTQGMRSYVAVRGGVAAEPVLGSRSSDTLSRLGPQPLAPGDVVPVGPSEPLSDRGFGELRELRDLRSGGDGGRAEGDTARDVVLLRLRLGPRDEWFTARALAVLEGSTYTVSGDSNRVGLRLTGPPLERERDEEIESEGMVLGAVQVPSSGEPLVFLADHPTTGGYPVIGVVDGSDLVAVAQARPGTRVRFVVLPE